MEAQPAAVCQAREKCQIPPLQIQSRSKLLRGTCWSRAHDADRIEEVVLKVLHVSLQKGLPSYLHMQMTKTEEFQNREKSFKTKEFQNRRAIHVPQVRC